MNLSRGNLPIPVSSLFLQPRTLREKKTPGNAARIFEAHQQHETPQVLLFGLNWGFYLPSRTIDNSPNQEFRALPIKNQEKFVQICFSPDETLKKRNDKLLRIPVSIWNGKFRHEIEPFRCNFGMCRYDFGNAGLFMNPMSITFLQPMIAVILIDRIDIKIIGIVKECDI
jgi:hypothetical protein